MRKTCASIIVVLTIGLLLFVSCEKEEIVETDSDYRTKWVGTYKCQKITSFSENSSSSQTIYLEVTLADEDSLLNINEERENEQLGTAYNYMDYKVMVDYYGDMWYYSGAKAMAYFDANFAGDSIFVRNFLIVGHNCMPHYIYKGKKI